MAEQNLMTKKVKKIIDQMSKKRDELRELESELSDILNSVTDSLEDIDIGIDYLKQAIMHYEDGIDSLSKYL